MGSVGAAAQSLETSMTPETSVLFKAAVESFLEELGGNGESVKRTPDRFSAALAEMTSGYEQNATSVLGSLFDAEDYDEMII